MRLLNACTFKLEEFFGPNIPEYAILSHTWGDDEITYRDIEDLEGAKKKNGGWRKLRRTCERAQRDGLKWVWIDTCCINKESSAELSEALNSMFQYYRDSFVCYAYLSDYDITKDGHPLHGNSSFRDCRWFSRGWTLQELLAPHDVLFFDINWTDLGTKYGLRDMIKDVTRIPSQVLVDGNLRNISIAARMSWAADRQTTRDEDRAYSLMGIFGVNMPPLYGEGGQRAFIRLQEEIIRYSNDQSIFAWNALPSDWQEERGLLARSPSEFRDSANVFVSWKSGTKPPYSMTNNGLHISLPLTPVNGSDFPGIPPKVFTAYLDCQLDPGGNYLGIFLHQLDTQEYVRWRPDLLVREQILRVPESTVELYVQDVQRPPLRRGRPMSVWSMDPEAKIATNTHLKFLGARSLISPRTRKDFKCVHTSCLSSRHPKKSFAAVYGIYQRQFFLYIEDKDQSGENHDWLSDIRYQDIPAVHLQDQAVFPLNALEYASVAIRKMYSTQPYCPSYRVEVGVIPWPLETPGAAPGITSKMPKAPVLVPRMIGLSISTEIQNVVFGVQPDYRVFFCPFVAGDIRGGNDRSPSPSQLPVNIIEGRHDRTHHETLLNGRVDRVSSLLVVSQFKVVPASNPLMMVDVSVTLEIEDMAFKRGRVEFGFQSIETLCSSLLLEDKQEVSLNSRYGSNTSGSDSLTLVETQGGYTVELCLPEKRIETLGYDLNWPLHVKFSYSSDTPNSRLYSDSDT